MSDEHTAARRRVRRLGWYGLWPLLARTLPSPLVTWLPDYLYLRAFVVAWCFNTDAQQRAGFLDWALATGPDGVPSGYARALQRAGGVTPGFLLVLNREAFEATRATGEKHLEAFPNFIDSEFVPNPTRSDVIGGALAIMSAMQRVPPGLAQRGHP